MLSNVFRHNFRNTIHSFWFLFTTGFILQVSTGTVAEERKKYELPEFIVPGQQKKMDSLQDLFSRHHSPHTNCTLWDAWLPMSILWPAIGDEYTAKRMREFYRNVFLRRFIDAQGYVTMDQHIGLAHPEGWPFPTWRQAGGAGWHFTHDRDHYAKFLSVPLATLQGWTLDGIQSQGLDNLQGLKLKLTRANAVLTSPICQANSFASPFIVLQWDHERLPVDAKPVLQWITDTDHEFSREREVCLEPEMTRKKKNGLSFSAIPVYRHPLWKGTIRQLRIKWNNRAPVDITFRAMHTAVDTRHPITNILFVQGSTDYFNWTTDTEFLQKNISRMRGAIEYAIDEFSVRENRCVLVRWVGHNGKAGFDREADGSKVIHFGQGGGNNYWDLLPFGHRDCLATIYLFDALNRLASLESQIEMHPEWKIGTAKQGFSSVDLKELASQIRIESTQKFWNPETKRFVACIDSDGKAHDYGFTFLNLEAIYYGFATTGQAREILDWIDGKLVVNTDTSQAGDIYHWEFAPRATTKRNTEWYVWAWHGPERIPWGGQVQDGGAVLGFSYFDMMARLKTNGPDDAWKRMQAILAWYDKVQQQGGYRAYYAKPGRGTLQGGGTAGGLGIDHEFFESVLVPQTMLYGFLGFKPIPGGFSINPNLPTTWPSLTITRIHVQDQVVAVTVSKGEIRIEAERLGGNPLTILLPDENWKLLSGPVVLENSRAVLRFTPANRMAVFTRKSAGKTD